MSQVICPFCQERHKDDNLITPAIPLSVIRCLKVTTISLKLCPALQNEISMAVEICDRPIADRNLRLTILAITDNDGTVNLRIKFSLYNSFERVTNLLSKSEALQLLQDLKIELTIIYLENKRKHNAGKPKEFLEKYAMKYVNRVVDPFIDAVMNINIGAFK